VRQDQIRSDQAALSTRASNTKVVMRLFDAALTMLRCTPSTHLQCCDAPLRRTHNAVTHPFGRPFRRRHRSRLSPSKGHTRHGRPQDPQAAPVQERDRLSSKPPPKTARPGGKTFFNYALMDVASSSSPSCRYKMRVVGTRVIETLPTVFLSLSSPCNSRPLILKSVDCLSSCLLNRRLCYLNPSA
jgi:hypothetical protein